MVSGCSGKFRRSSPNPISRIDEELGNIAGEMGCTVGYIGSIDGRVHYVIEKHGLSQRDKDALSKYGLQLD